MSGSITNILTATQNVVTALNAATQNAVQLAGAKNATGITATTVVSTNPGRIVVMSVIVAGAAGFIYDASTTAGATATRYVAVIPATVGVYVINIPVAYGIVVAPGAGQTVTVSYT